MTVRRTAAQLSALAAEGLDIAMEYQQNEDDGAALATLLAGNLTALTHAVTLLEEIAVKMGVEIDGR